jgi:uncharacterized protein DUF222
MFDSIVVDELDTAGALAAAAELQTAALRAQTKLLEIAAHYADLHHPGPRDPGGPVLPGAERAVVHGGDGCPPIAEFATIELGLVLGTSTGVATGLIADALALRHRLPRTWARVRDGDIPAWRARRVAQATTRLNQAAAALVDARVAPLLETLTDYRLDRIIKAVVMEADPDLARKKAAAAQRDRGVYLSRSDDHGTRAVYIRAAAGDACRFYAAVNALADRLAITDTTHKDELRAKAIGWLANPTAALHLIHTTQPHATHADDSSVTDAPAQSATTPPAAAPRPAAAATHGTDPDSPTNADHTARQSAELESVELVWTEPECLAEPDWTPASLATQPPRPDPDDPPHPAHPAHPDDPDVDTGPATGWLAAYNPGHPPGQPIDTTASHTAAGERAAKRFGSGVYELVVHLTDHTLATGDGLARVQATSSGPRGGAGPERELGPQLASQVADLLGHPDLITKIVVKPVIDLRDRIAVDAYEIPARIRERVILQYPVSPFPWSNHFVTSSTDLDHIRPYRQGAPPGQPPPGQTSTDNLAPQARFHHRARTFGILRCRLLPDGALEWTTRHGYRYRVDHTGTHRLPNERDADPPVNTC